MQRGPNQCPWRRAPSSVRVIGCVRVAHRIAEGSGAGLCYNFSCGEKGTVEDGRRLSFNFEMAVTDRFNSTQVGSHVFVYWNHLRALLLCAVAALLLPVLLIVAFHTAYEGSNYGRIDAFEKVRQPRCRPRC